MERINVYSGAGLDRADHLRLDEAAMDRLMRDPATRFVAVWRSYNLVLPLANESDPPPGAVWLRGRDAIDLAGRAGERVFLGIDGAEAYVALDFSSLEHPQQEPVLRAGGEFRDLREVGALLPQRDGSILAYARGLMHWHARHRFCGRCGAPTETARGGHLRVCTGGACAIEHFPRTDPAVIMLVHDGTRCVLGRRHDWPPGLHSTLAGFVEPGESLEESVAREVREEVGLDVPLGGIAYHSSQPWPFPASLMLGFHARAGYAPLNVYTRELESARWVSRDALLSLSEDDDLRLPRPDSIARRLIEDWLARDSYQQS